MIRSPSTSGDSVVTGRSAAASAARLVADPDHLGGGGVATVVAGDLQQVDHQPAEPVQVVGQQAHRLADGRR